MSIAGGYHRALESAFEAGATALQIFTKNNNQWRAKPIADAEAAVFAATRARLGIAKVVAHSSYLINLASPDDALWEKSTAAFVEELLRCEALGVSHLIFHPGAHVGSSDAAAVKRVARALDRAHRETKGLRCRSTLEVTAGQGTCIGHRFEHLRGILDGLREPERAAVCLDTCHLFAAGYDISTAEGYAATMDELDRVVGCARVEAFHVNDSKKGLACRVDRHEHVAEGAIGATAFQCLMNDPRFTAVPMVIETPKEGKGVALDCRNLRRLVAMISP
jgi:deoxyribonuclease-4